ncbi:hypothetical protein D9M72_644840 [compost metagenome]
MKQVHEEGFENIFAMMPENDCGAAFFPRDAIKIAATQARAKRAIGARFRQLLRHNRIGILIFDTMLDPILVQKIGQNVLWKIWLSLIEIDCQQFDRQQATPFKVEQQSKQTIRILAA